MKNESKLKLLKIWLIFVFFILFFIETRFHFTYIHKALYKFITLGILSSIFFFIVTKKNSLKLIILKPNKNIIKWIIPIVLSLIFIFLSVKKFIDFENIKLIINDIGVNKNTYITTCLYISFVNSFLEEYFFRGLYFLGISRYKEKKFLGHFSALIFSLYHTSILMNWFEIWIFILALFGLYLVGLFFNYLDAKSKSIFNSYLIHISANLTICIIGYIVMFM